MALWCAPGNHHGLEMVNSHRYNLKPLTELLPGSGLASCLRKYRGKKLLPVRVILPPCSIRFLGGSRPSNHNFFWLQFYRTSGTQVQLHTRTLAGAPGAPWGPWGSMEPPGAQGAPWGPGAGLLLLRDDEDFQSWDSGKQTLCDSRI